MSDYTVVWVNADQLHGSPQQPETRKLAIGPLNHLKNSIQKYNLQIPPLVMALPQNQYQIIDGHRRVAVMMDLGYPKIPVLVTQGNPGDLFAQVSGVVSKVKASEWVEVYLKGGVVPGGPTSTCIKRLDVTVGREYLKKLVQKGMSPQIWNLANRVIKCAGTDFSENHRVAILEWLLDVGTREVSAWISGTNRPEELRRAFDERRSPIMRLAA